MALGESEKERYNRQIIIPHFGEEGQLRLKKAKVLLVGAGGLGSSAAYYLAAAGVGVLGIVDADNVELTNLNRQILHTTKRLGVPKAVSAREALQELNPEIEVRAYPSRLAPENAADFIREYDLVVGAVDNFETRYLLNETCVREKKVLVEAGVTGWSGLVMTIKPGEGPCYACLFPTPPPSKKAPVGVVGAVPGVIGAIQAAEAIKVILGQGKTLTGRILLYNALEGSFQEVVAARNPSCPVCAGAGNQN